MNDRIVVRQVVIPSVTFTKADESRECLGRWPIFRDGCVFGGPFLYKDQIYVDSKQVDPKRLSICGGYLTLDGIKMENYAIHHDDGNIENWSNKPKIKRNRRSEVELLQSNVKYK